MQQTNIILVLAVCLAAWVPGHTGHYTVCVGEDGHLDLVLAALCEAHGEHDHEVPAVHDNHHAPCSDIVICAGDDPHVLAARVALNAPSPILPIAAVCDRAMHTPTDRTQTARAPPGFAAVLLQLRTVLLLV